MIYDLHVLFNLSNLCGAFRILSLCAEVSAIGPHYVVFVFEDVVIHGNHGFYNLIIGPYHPRIAQWEMRGKCDMGLCNIFQLASRNLSSISKNRRGKTISALV